MNFSKHLKSGYKYEYENKLLKVKNIQSKENNMEQITNTDDIRNIILEVINENMEVAKTFDPEKGRMLDFFVGQVMKKTRGKANPSAASEILKEELLKLVGDK